MGFFQTGHEGGSKDDWGVNYRALNDLFDISQNRRSTYFYQIGVQMVEIYNEQVRDLLSNDNSQKRYPFSSYFCQIMLHILFFFIFPNY